MRTSHLRRILSVLLAGALAFHALPFSTLAAAANTCTLRARAARQHQDTSAHLKADLFAAAAQPVPVASVSFAPPAPRTLLSQKAIIGFSRAALIFFALHFSAELLHASTGQGDVSQDLSLFQIIGWPLAVILGFSAVEWMVPAGRNSTPHDSRNLHTLAVIREALRGFEGNSITGKGLARITKLSRDTLRRAGWRAVVAEENSRRQVEEPDRAPLGTLPEMIPDPEASKVKQALGDLLQMAWSVDPIHPDSKRLMELEEQVAAFRTQQFTVITRGGKEYHLTPVFNQPLRFPYLTPRRRYALQPYWEQGLGVRLYFVSEGEVLGYNIDVYRGATPSATRKKMIAALLKARGVSVHDARHKLMAKEGLSALILDSTHLNPDAPDPKALADLQTRLDIFRRQAVMIPTSASHEYSLTPIANITVKFQYLAALHSYSVQPYWEPRLGLHIYFVRGDGHVVGYAIEAYSGLRPTAQRQRIFAHIRVRAPELDIARQRLSNRFFRRERAYRATILPFSVDPHSYQVTNLLARDDRSDFQEKAQRLQGRVMALLIAHGYTSKQISWLLDLAELIYDGVFFDEAVVETTIPSDRYAWVRIQWENVLPKLLRPFISTEPVLERAEEARRVDEAAMSPAGQVERAADTLLADSTIVTLADQFLEAVELQRRAEALKALRQRGYHVYRVRWPNGVEARYRSALSEHDVRDFERLLEEKLWPYDETVTELKGTTLERSWRIDQAFRRIVRELARNIQLHAAARGVVLARSITQEGREGVELIVRDLGHGLDLPQAMEPGYTTRPHEAVLPGYGLPVARDLSVWGGHGLFVAESQGKGLIYQEVDGQVQLTETISPIVHGVVFAVRRFRASPQPPALVPRPPPGPGSGGMVPLGPSVRSANEATDAV